MNKTDDLITGYNIKNVSTGGPVEGGCCYTSFADNPTLPQSASESLVEEGSDFENLGELSDQGWTQGVSTNVSEFKGYHGKIVLTEVTDEKVTVKVEFLEVVRSTVLKLRYGAQNVEEDEDGFVSSYGHTSVPSDILPLIFDELLSNGIKQRTVFPRCKIETIDDQAHQKGSLLVYGMTFTAYVDDSGEAFHVYHARPAGSTTRDTRLASLSVGEAEFVPDFSPYTKVYAVSVEQAANVVSAAATDEGATVSIDAGGTLVASGDEVTFEQGRTVVSVIVTNGDRTSVYTVLVTYAE